MPDDTPKDAKPGENAAGEKPEQTEATTDGKADDAKAADKPGDAAPPEGPTTGETAPGTTGPSAAEKWKPYVELARGFIVRAAQSDFRKNRATDAEREALAAADTPITDELAQDYAAWRRAVLWVASGVLIITALLRVIQWAADESPGSAVISLFMVLWAVAVPVCATLFVLAALRWTDLRKSRHLARVGWAAMFLTPLVMSLIPWSQLVDTQGDPQVSMAIGFVMGAFLFVAAIPMVIALCSGMIRSALALKGLLPESGLGWVVVGVAPVLSIFIISVFSLVNQFAGSILLMLGLIGLVAGPLTYVWYAPDVTRPHRVDEVSGVLAKVRMRANLVGGMGAILLVLWAFTADMGIGNILQFAVTLAAGMFSLLVVGADFLLGVLHLTWREQHRFIGSDMDTELGKRFKVLEAAGMTELPPLARRVVPALAKPDGEEPTFEPPSKKEKRASGEKAD